eukprot:scaffold126568_cov14-Tisochrysis_lutea.AAC.1
MPRRPEPAILWENCWRDHVHFTVHGDAQKPTATVPAAPAITCTCSRAVALANNAIQQRALSILIE